ncbi:MAG: hypothetical protein ACFFD2_05485 [Promethearchaeota archaeon]
MSHKVLIVTNSRIVNNIEIKLKNIIEKFDIKVRYTPFKKHLDDILEKENITLVFNLIPLINNSYSLFLPALCNLLEIPYLGSGIFTISALTEYQREILEYHKLKKDVCLLRKLYNISVIGNSNDMIFNIKVINGMRFPHEQEFIDKNLLLKIKNIIDIIKKSLKINDYFMCDLVQISPSIEEFYYREIIPSPSLNENSPFCISLMDLGFSYEDIIGAILLSAMKRNQISPPHKLKKVQRKINLARYNRECIKNEYEAIWNT